MSFLDLDNLRTLRTLGFLILAACGSAEQQLLQPQSHLLQADAATVLDGALAAATVEESVAVVLAKPTPRVLRLEPEPDLWELTQLAIKPFVDMGLDVRIEAGGVPMGVVDELGNKCGRAVADAVCTFDECEAANARIWIRRSPACMKRIIVAHEIGHIVSRWGRCAESGADRDGHVSGATELMSELGGGLVGPESRRMICSCGICPEED